MIEQLPTVVPFLKQLQQIPYLASKNLYRVAAHFLEMPEDKAAQFCAALLAVKRAVTVCAECGMWQEQKCIICTNPARDRSMVCVVETWADLAMIERTHGYQGIYHVLGGALSPLDGIGPDDLRINMLERRVRELPIREIIIATNQTPEGEATAALVRSVVQDIPEKIITTLARGVPAGASLEYMDRVTLYKALTERRPL